MQPLKFRPLLRRIRWGGRRLGTTLGKPIGDKSDYAESWEIADCGDEQTVVEDGPLCGWTLARVVAERGVDLFGIHRGPTRFPLLIKFIDANDRLSVQVHPDDDAAQRMGLGPNGKSEAWVILDAQPQSRIYVGLKPGIDRAALVRHLDAGTVEECLHAYLAKRGDCIFVPAGTVHAIGEGILLAEIQQTSDVTFRLYDWGRVGLDGKPRTLHRDEALACIDFQRGPVDPVVPRYVADACDRTEELVRCDYFVLRRHTISRPFPLPEDGRFRVIMPFSGTVHVSTGEYSKRIGVGDTLLIPAATKGVHLSPARQASVLEAHLP